MHEPGGPTWGIPSQLGGLVGVLQEEFPEVRLKEFQINVLGGPTSGIHAPAMTTRGANGGGKKWCIGKQNIKKGLLKKAFEELCKEVDCSPT